VAPTYTFDEQLPSRTFTAHPKLDSHTGNMVAFGYEMNSRAISTSDEMLRHVTNNL
jgi:carotenoid cleavage dioxygenase-like enzyme